MKTMKAVRAANARLDQVEKQIDVLMKSRSMLLFFAERPRILRYDVQVRCQKFHIERGWTRDELIAVLGRAGIEKRAGNLVHLVRVIGAQVVHFLLQDGLLVRIAES